MDRHPFDALTRVLYTAPSRRALLPLLGSVLAVPVPGLLPVDAKKKKKKKKTTLCLDGQTIQASKKKKKKLLKRGATPGACSPPICTPSCAANACGGDDGCGGICACAANALCYSGICHTCSVTCTGDGTTCGNELKTALNGGGTVYACPGRYVGNFTLTAANVSLIGAGDGDAPATNTILDANGSGRVMLVNANVNAALHGLRLTGGNLPTESGGGINTLGTLTLTACTVARNTAIGAGGIFHPSVATGPLTLNDCVVSENNALDGSGGGIINGNAVLLTINGSTLSGNTAGAGGGLSNGGGTAIFDGASRVTGNTCTTTNCGGGIHNNVGSVVILNGAEVSGNTPNNCVNVDGCVG